MQQELYRVIKKIPETRDTTSLIIKRQNGRASPFIPGQYLTVYFPESGTPEGKSYSISSAQHEEELRLTVKAMGEFSNRLTHLRENEELVASPPYGFFYSENNDTDIVLVAAGIGIAPFRSMIHHIILNQPKRKILLFYSSRTSSDIIFRDELDKLQKAHPLFSVRYYVTREGDKKRINPREVTEGLPHLRSPEFFLCGSIEFVRDMWKGFKEAGVPEDALYTEAFFSH